MSLDPANHFGPNHSGIFLLYVGEECPLHPRVPLFCPMGIQAALVWDPVYSPAAMSSCIPRGQAQAPCSLKTGSYPSQAAAAPC